MKYEREFILPLTGKTSEPKHYAFDLGEEFLAFTQFPETEKGHVHLDLELEKRSSFISLQFKFEGSLRLCCDRCAEDYDQPVKGDFKYILKYGNKLEEESEEVMLIPSDLHEFDVQHLIYEYLMLMVPIRKVHLPDAEGHSTCNPETIAVLERLSKANEVDPRWSALQGMFNHDETNELNQ